MISDIKYQYPVRECKSVEELKNGAWLVVLHASRIPPHVGLMINGNYNSLTIKERELNISIEALSKTIQQKKIESIFIRLVNHPVFSLEYQLGIFQVQLKTFQYVEQGVATCLSPLKLFFEEFYAVKNNPAQLFYDFLDNLNENDYLRDIVGMNLNLQIGENIFSFPTYTSDQLSRRIKQERYMYYKK